VATVTNVSRDIDSGNIDKDRPQRPATTTTSGDSINWGKATVDRDWRQRHVIAAIGSSDRRKRPAKATGNSIN